MRHVFKDIGSDVLEGGSDIEEDARMASYGLGVPSQIGDRISISSRHLS